VGSEGREKKGIVVLTSNQRKEKRKKLIHPLYAEKRKKGTNAPNQLVVVGEEKKEKPVLLLPYVEKRGNRLSRTRGRTEA